MAQRALRRDQDGGRASRRVLSRQTRRRFSSDSSAGGDFEICAAGRRQRLCVAGVCRGCHRRAFVFNVRPATCPSVIYVKDVLRAILTLFDAPGGTSDEARL